VPYPKGTRKGDLLVEVRVVIPRKLSARQQHLLNELAKEEPEPQASLGDAQANDEGLLKKLWHSFTDLGHDQKKDQKK